MTAIFGELPVSKRRLNYKELTEGLNEQYERSAPLGEALLT